MRMRPTSCLGSRASGPITGTSPGPGAPGLRRLTDGLPLVSLPALVIAVQDSVPAWVCMCLMAAALYAGVKWLVYRLDSPGATRIPTTVRWLFLLGWVGMSLREFAEKPGAFRQPLGLAPTWAGPLVKTLGGAGLVWGVLRMVPADPWWLRGWLGMAGCILLLHFGIFHLLALAFQRAGYGARPLMNRPLLAASIAEFWGARWNTAFRALTERFVFRPLVRRVGAKGAMAVTFLVSGLIHDLAITVPARGGYGLPTLYFATQAAGILVERAAWFRRHPGANRVLAWIVVGGPVSGLFPPVFVREVILPMLEFAEAF